MALNDQGFYNNHPSREQLILDTIINNIPAMVFYKSLDGTYIAANEMFCHQLNTTPDAIIGKSDFDFYDTSSAMRFRDSDLEVIETGRSVDLLEDEIELDGEFRIFTTRKVLLKDHNGVPYGIIGLSYDVTETHRAEQEQIESRTRYKYMYNVFRLMADNIPDLLWAKDLRKHYLFANKAVCETILGAADTQEPIGRTDEYFADRERRTHPEDKDWHTFGDISSETDDLIMRQKTAGRFDMEGNIRGEYIFLDVQKAPIMDDDGNMIGTVGSGRDITKQKLMEHEFHSLYQRNQAIIKALPDLMFLFDDQATYLEIYASISGELLEDPDHIIGKTVADFFDQEISGKTREAITQCLLTDTIQSFDYKIVIDSETRYYEARLIKVDEQKVLCIARNVTVQATLQQELMEAKEKAEESSRLKTTLLHNMSHEIRTPLNGILGFSDIMIKELKDPDYLEMATYINKSGRRLMKTLDSIMQLSQLESGIKMLQADNVDLEIEFRKILESFAEIAAEKGLFLEIREIPSCHGYLDAFFFNQAISNILENAIKFTNEGGVYIEIQQTSREGRRFLLIKIVDTGIGISETHRKIIFDEFRQVSEGRNRNFEGTGLGLTIAIKMIQLLKGDIQVESEMGKGSVFNVSLPFPETAEWLPYPDSLSGLPHQTRSAGENRESGRAILVIDEEELNAQRIQVYLKGQYRVDWAATGKSAVEMVKQHHYKAILTEVNAGPGVTGIQDAQLIRTIRAYREIPVIALTSFTKADDRDKLMKAGYTSYLTKPVTKPDLLQLLGRVIQGR